MISFSFISVDYLSKKTDAASDQNYQKYIHDNPDCDFEDIQRQPKVNLPKQFTIIEINLPEVPPF